MFKYREIGEILAEESLVESVLRTRGLSRAKVNALLNAQKEDMEDWQHLDNIKEGAKMLIRHIRQGNLIGLLVDCDNDGIASGAEMYNYLKEYNPNIEIKVFLHKAKQHGLSYDVFDTIAKSGIKLLLVPDAGTNDIEEQKKLVNLGIDILNIDHHNYADEWEKVNCVITVNPQGSQNYQNKSISGSGVVYKFLQCMDEMLGINNADNYLDLAGMGCVADVMSGTEIDTRFLMNCCVDQTKIKNPFLKYLIIKKIGSGDLNLTSMAWSIVPSINSVMRLGTQVEKESVFNAFINLEGNEEVLEQGYKKANACKSRQDRLKKNALISCTEKIEEQKLYEYPVIVLDVTNLFDDDGLNGVIANGLSETYNRPVIVIGGENEVNRGSCRNVNESMCGNFRRWCKDTGLFDLCEGHDNSFGVEIKVDNYIKIMEKAKEDFNGTVETDKTFIVEKVFNFSDLTKKEVLAIGELKDLWVTNIKEPTFLIKNVRINSSKIERCGSKNNVMRFVVGDFTFMKFFLSNALFEKVTLKNEVAFGSVNLRMDVLCKFKKNEFNEKVSPQLEVIDIYSEKDEVSLDDIF